MKMDEDRWSSHSCDSDKDKLYDHIDLGILFIYLVWIIFQLGLYRLKENTSLNFIWSIFME